MKICGIIAEYNPFHTGHGYHIAQTKALLGAESAVVCAMSGNFVQRGDAAILDKYERAHAAVCGGADLVIELPLPAVLSSASGFARGGIDTFCKLGCVDFLSFGSECGDLALLLETAEMLQEYDRADDIRQALQRGLSYPAARYEALKQHSPHHAQLLETANNTLGLEYLLALQQSGAAIAPLTVQRTGTGHDGTELKTAVYPSASALRRHLLAGDTESCVPHLPADSLIILRNALQTGATPNTLKNCESALLSYFRRFSQDALLPFCDGDIGLASRIHSAIRSTVSLDALCETAQTRCYTLARIRRTLLRLYLNRPDVSCPDCHYIRVLAVGARGRDILRLASKKATVPIITRPASIGKLPSALQNELAADALVEDLYTLTCPAEGSRRCGESFRKTPFILMR